MRKPTLGNGEIVRITKSLGLEQIKVIKEITSASVNPVYVINNTYILIIDTSEVPNLASSPNEVVINQLLPKFGTPAPELVVYDKECKLVKYPFVLLKTAPNERQELPFNKQEMDNAIALIQNSFSAEKRT